MGSVKKEKNSSSGRILDLINGGRKTIIDPVSARELLCPGAGGFEK